MEGQGGAAGAGGPEEKLRHRFVDECIARADNLMLARKRRLVCVYDIYTYTHIHSYTNTLIHTHTHT